MNNVLQLRGVGARARQPSIARQPFSGKLAYREGGTKGGRGRIRCAGKLSKHPLFL